jgi:hypothetical protein
MKLTHLTEAPSAKESRVDAVTFLMDVQEDLNLNGRAARNPLTTASKFNTTVKFEFDTEKEMSRAIISFINYMRDKRYSTIGMTPRASGSRVTDETGDHRFTRYVFQINGFLYAVLNWPDPDGKEKVIYLTAYKG